MAARKMKKTRASKKTKPARKSRLWLRDLMNILGGLLVGTMGFWAVTSYVEDRGIRKTSKKFVEVIQDSASGLKPFAERYLAVEEGSVQGTLVLKGLDMGKPVGAPDSLRRTRQDVTKLSSGSLVLLWDYEMNLHEAELIRKFIQVQREDPDQLSQVLDREFLRALYEDSRMSKKLIWILKHPTEEQGEE